jgi:hypothetical protein
LLVVTHDALKIRETLDREARQISARRSDITCHAESV